MYNILNGYPAGVYVYTATFTDDYGNSLIDSVTFTVVEATNGDGEGGIPGASLNIILIIFMGIVAPIIMVKRKKQL